MSRRPPFARRAASLVLAALLACIAGCGNEPETVVVFGDSIGRGNELGDAGREHAWVNRLPALEPRSLQVVNLSMPGRDSDSVDDFKAALARNPRIDFLVIALGTNDSVDPSSETPQRTAQNVTAMVRMAQQGVNPPRHIILVGPPNLASTRQGYGESLPERSRTIERIGDAISEVARNHGCGYVGLYRAIPDGGFLPDGLHPNAAGNDLIARAVLAEIRRLRASDAKR